MKHFAFRPEQIKMRFLFFVRASCSLLFSFSLLVRFYCVNVSFSFYYTLPSFPARPPSFLLIIHVQLFIYFQDYYVIRFYRKTCHFFSCFCHANGNLYSTDDYNVCNEKKIVPANSTYKK